MNVELTAVVRTETGKGPARRLRASGQVPAVCYGQKLDALPMAVPANLLERYLREAGQETHLISLVVEDGEKTLRKKVMFKELQRHPVKRQILHVDFHEVALDQMVDVDIPVELTGVPEGVKMGGIMTQMRRSIAVQCLPSEIPDKISLDVSSLQIGDSIHVADLVGRYSFRIVDEERFTIVTVTPPETGAVSAGGEGEGQTEQQREEVTAS
ncbi:50S ribosomal protein L25/general stress protein Ctc [Desulfoglaeba alkanexedens]|jgi:large subunit ribosomal protein L25|uniref:Large ribosomal subunit protein bL25 n=1 Tax=Desulfoglaeba alkanexedens ALDC TaxID=980445 RepID=A0A4P8L1F3_9BACT|nr:50S ribosomal protein L25/general stress protein Ctc [Desulfoglaeba alkanexedens]QCQ21668.1 50S ribosomal protein L25/general stress protein Ctc [Desulfoglaeba alkanexedens ALDC]